MFKIAICDDEQVVCMQLRSILKEIESGLAENFIVEVFSSGKELYQYIVEGGYYDIIFLDIEMGEMDGIDFGQRLREELTNEATQIIYISGKETYAMELFKVRPFDFIIKPLAYEDVYMAMKRVIKFLSRNDKFFEYKIGHTTYRIPVKDIIYFESQGRKINIVTQNGIMTFYGKLDAVEKQLTNLNFIRIHKSYLVKYEYIIKFEYTQVTMSNDVILPISQSNRKRVRQLQIKLKRRY
ncbi:MAG TPA: response regulator transcription factor [Clostridiales bacterium]|nr:response regulator transcription factor [Clostridiales bacterium]